MRPPDATSAAPRLVRRALMISILLLFGVVLAGGAVPDATGRIQACYGSGGVRIVDSPADCRAAETSVSWIQDAPPPPPPPAHLLVVLDGNAEGLVESFPPGIQCGRVCLAAFPAGTNVTLTARATGLVRFDGWSGACAGMGTCVITMAGAQSVGATFGQGDWVSVGRTGGATGTVASTPPGIACPPDCMSWFPYGTEVTLTTTPESGAALIGGVFGPRCIRAPANGCTFVLRDTTFTELRFEFVHRLEVANVAGGTVTRSPSASTCNADGCFYVRGTTVTLQASPRSDTIFTGWSGDCSGSSPTCTLTMDGDKFAHAHFVLAWRLSVAKAGQGSGHVGSSPGGIDCGSDCVERVPVNSQVTLTATPDPGSRFVEWGGACVGSTSPTCTFTMGFDKSVVAWFEPST